MKVIQNYINAPHRHHSIGNVYRIRMGNHCDVYLMTFHGYDIDGDPRVNLVCVSSGLQWTDPIYVADPYNMTDDELIEIIDPKLQGVEYTNFGPLTGAEVDCVEGSHVQRTI